MTNSQESDSGGFKQDVRDLRADMDVLKEDAKHVAQDAAAAARSGVAEIRQGATSAVEIAKNKLADRYGEAKATASDATDSLKEIISRNPLASMGVVAGVGILLGMACSRPRS